MALLAVNDVQRRAGRSQLLAGVVQELNVFSYLGHTVHHGSITDAVNHQSMAQSLSQHFQRINHVSIMPVLCEARSIRKYYSKILTDHRDEMARGDVGRQADAIESMQHGIATALRCSFQPRITELPGIHCKLNIRSENKLRHVVQTQKLR
jgi:hypothetical protein